VVPESKMMTLQFLSMFYFCYRG